MKKTFDAVRFQRKVREKLGREYAADRRAFLRDLSAKYGRPKKQEAVATKS